jgi:N-hydroxyarylamine O-acetyltransferase
MFDLEAYLRRVEYTGSREPTLDTLRALHLKHPLAIPFETLDTLSGRTVALDAGALQRKLVDERRGGYCFEHNLLFSHVLRALGFEVAALAARVVWMRPDDGRRPRTHMLLFVQLGEGGYFCDVGFGGLTLTAPLRLEPDVEQPTPHETCRVRREGREFSLEARVQGQWQPMYRFDLQEQRQVDIEVLNHYVATHADSPLRGVLLAAKPGVDRRYGLRNNQLSIHHRDGRSEHQELASGAALRAVLEQTFGIAVPADPRIDEALARMTG